MRSRTERFVCWAVCVGTVLAWAGEYGAAERRVTRRPTQSAYYDSKEVTLHSPPAKRSRVASLGPWWLGKRASRHKPHDKRLNLYVVAPGRQYRAEGWEFYDHNVVISGVPLKKGAIVEWDVYWAVVLDPAVGDDVRSERDLLLAGQTDFRPDPNFEFDQIPGARFLRRVLAVDGMSKLDQYRRKDGSLPQVLIVPAGFAIEAEAALAHSQ